MNEARALPQMIAAIVALVLMMTLLPGPAFGEPSSIRADGTLHPVPEPVSAPPFALPDLDGEVHRLADYRGKVVVLNFWATWCPPCREEMPAMQRAWDEVQDEDIVILGVNVGEDNDTVFLFTADYPVDFPLLLDRQAEVIERYRVTGLPTTYIIDPRGRITHRTIGTREWDDPQLLDALRALRDRTPQ